MITVTETIRQILDFALENGATRTTVISPGEVQVKNQFADFCREPGCPFYGKSMSCPPNVSGPEVFRKKLMESQYAVVIRLEVDKESMMGKERHEVFRILQELAAVTEQKAKSLGFTDSEGFAAGSCRISFCKGYDHCQVLHGNGTCRHPDSARPSMSGFGVHVGKLMKSAGWSSTFLKDDGENKDQMTWVAALVLLKPAVNR